MNLIFVTISSSRSQKSNSKVLKIISILDFSVAEKKIVKKPTQNKRAYAKEKKYELTL